MLGWLDIAGLVAYSDLNGSFVAKAGPGLPFLLQEGMRVALVPPVTDMPRNVTVCSVSKADGAAARVRFAETEGLEGAAALKGCHCLVQSDALSDVALMPDIPLGEGVLGECGIAGAGELVGWQLTDEAGQALGTVSDVQAGPAHPFLMIALTDGGDAMVPLVADLIAEADASAQRIAMGLPKGLLEL